MPYVSCASERRQYRLKRESMAKSLMVTLDFCGDLSRAASDLLYDEGFKVTQERIDELAELTRVLYNNEARKIKALCAE